MSVRCGLLALLAREAKHGYQLKTDFETATGGVWKLNVGQVYTTLDRLARDGCVVVEVDQDQKRYAITAAGREELAGWWEDLPGDDPPPRDELVVKVLLAIAANPQGLDVITRQRTALTEVLQRHRRALRGEARTAAGVDGLVSRLAADAVVVLAEGHLRWLDLCEARLLDHRRTGNGHGSSTEKAQNEEAHR